MGYDLHITRKKNWDGFEDEHGPQISVDEWIALVRADAEMRLDGFCEVRLPEGKVFRVDHPSIAVWTAWSHHGGHGDMAWFHHHHLLVEYRCPVVDRLEQIYAAIDRAHPQNLFLIICLAGRPQDYVQCVFDTRTRMLCEASSGYYDSKPDEPRAYRLPARSIAALGRLGFSTDDSAGNFQIWLDVSEPPDLNRIADFTLKALHDGYGARAGGKLEFNAPLAPRTSSQCVPVG